MEFLSLFLTSLGVFGTWIAVWFAWQHWKNNRKG